MAQFHVLAILEALGGEAFEASIARAAAERGIHPRMSARMTVFRYLRDLERKGLVKRCRRRGQRRRIVRWRIVTEV